MRDLLELDKRGTGFSTFNESTANSVDAGNTDAYEPMFTFEGTGAERLSSDTSRGTGV